VGVESSPDDSLLQLIKLKIIISLKIVLVMFLGFGFWFDQKYVK
jgi:hypothetical protein